MVQTWKVCIAFKLSRVRIPPFPKFFLIFIKLFIKLFHLLSLSFASFSHCLCFTPLGDHKVLPPLGVLRSPKRGKPSFFCTKGAEKGKPLVSLLFFAFVFHPYGSPPGKDRGR